MENIIVLLLIAASQLNVRLHGCDLFLDFLLFFLFSWILYLLNFRKKCKKPKTFRLKIKLSLLF